MLSANFKRSVATLGVVAGLLAAAVPASAGPAGVPGDQPNDALYTVKAPAQLGTEGNNQPSHGGDQMKYYLEQAWPVTGDAGSGANNLRGEAIDIIP
jgi:hypothetical protein